MDASRFAPRIFNWRQLTLLAATLLLVGGSCNKPENVADRNDNPRPAPATSAPTTAPAPAAKHAAAPADAVEAAPVTTPGTAADTASGTTAAEAAPAANTFAAPESFAFAADEERGADDENTTGSFGAFGAFGADEPAAAAAPSRAPAAVVVADNQPSKRRSFGRDYSLGEDEEHPGDSRALALSGFGNGVFKFGDGFTTVKVFYATDRARFDYFTVSHAAFLPAFAALAAILTVLAGIAAGISIRGRRFFGWTTTVCFVATVVLSGISWLHPVPPPVLAGRPLPVRYTGDRGEVELGVCEIGVPQDHTMGHVETPSFFKFELTEDPSKHVRVNKVSVKSENEFFADLKTTVGSSPRKEILVFVHGYNVAFNDAARRTAQIAYDLEFEGAPVFFSWPSQKSLLGYTVDENNVAWATPHLKQFLLDIARKSEATSIHLIAHSMGNRALTGALRELALEFREDARMFNQVVLAAPDVDAGIFLRDIAPQITRTAQRVTLYASSNDRALKASKRIHGYPRAGESGSLLLIAPGIETIDVSALDTSFLGHSYYGDSNSIIADMHHLFRTVRSARERAWLTSMERGGQRYWEFRQKVAVARRRVSTAISSDAPHENR